MQKPCGMGELCRTTDEAPADPPLVVDVDGSLIGGDLLIEGVARLLSVSPLSLFALPSWLVSAAVRGRAGLKRRIAEAVPLPPETLALNPAVLKEIAAAHAAGRSVWLVSASDARGVSSLAETVGSAGCLASEGRTILAGEARAAALVAHFGERGFDYIGNERRDLAVWKRARRVIGVDLAAGLAHKLRALVALVLVGGAYHIGVSARQNLRLTAEALESGYIGKSLNTTYWEDSELVEYIRANPVSGQYRYYGNSPNVLRWNAGVPGTRMSWVSMPRRNLSNIYDCPRWFGRAVSKSRRYGEPEEHVVWVGQGKDSRIVCGLLQMESPLPLEPVAELADGAIFRVNAAFDSAGARQSALDALVFGEPAVRSDFDLYMPVAGGFKNLWKEEFPWKERK